MYYTDAEKAVYSPPGLDGRFDPLHLRRDLLRATGGRLDDLVADAFGDEPAASDAEGRLAAAARVAFALPDFDPGPTDGTVLEALFAFLWYLEGKGPRPRTTPTSPTSTGSAADPPTPTTSASS